MEKPIRAGDVRIRPDTVYAWNGPSVLITNCRGECTDDLTLTGYYFRETRYLATLRLEVNGEPPWLCEVATPEPNRMELLLLYPEMTELGGGGSGQSGDEVTRNELGIPYRSLNLQLSYRVGPSSLDAELIVTNHSSEAVRCEIAWALGTDFADLQEAHAGKRQIETPVRAEPRSDAVDERAAELAESFFDLALLYPDHRVPECIGGYGRAERRSPGAYPRANAPQAWNASAFPLLLHALLGLQPVAPLKLLVVDPALPTWMPEVFLRGLRLGEATLTLRCWRDGKGASHAEIVEKHGTVHLLRQPPPESLSAGVTDRIKALAESLIHH